MNNREFSMNTYLISVIIPVYNVEKYVKDAVLSICNQSYKNLQIIIIDDCSTDDTYKITEELARLDSRILLLRNNENSKIVKTLNLGLQYARGEFIARMDGDDLSSPERIKKQLDFLLHNPEYDLVGCHVITIDPTGKKIGTQRLPTHLFSLRKSLLYFPPVLHIWLARASVYKELGGYREIPGVEDYDFLLRMFSKGLYFTNLNSFEYSVRVRDGNTNSTIGFNQRLMSNYVVYLFKMRQKNGKDSFSEKDVKAYLAKYYKYKDRFDHSNDSLAKAFIHKGNNKYFFMFWFVMLAVLRSKFQLQYLIKRVIFKFYSKV